MTLTAAGLFWWCAGSHADAAAGAAFGGPVGATDINNAYLPPPGFFFGGLVNAFGAGSKLANNTGQETRAPVTVDVQAIYLGYTYPFKIAGGTLASGIEPSYDSPYAVKFGGTSYHADGWGDIYVDLLNWSKYIGPILGDAAPSVSSGQPPIPYGLTLKAEYSMIFPTAQFNPNRPLNATEGTFFFIPNLAATYLTRPDFLGSGLELNLHVFYDHQSTNWTDDYYTGDIVDFDYAADQKFGRWTLGVTGSYALQIQDDTRGSRNLIVLPYGKHFETFRIGPVVKFDIPKLHAAIKIKATFPVVVHNALVSDAVVGVLAIAF